jgi:site-specific DNA recombinase
VSKPAAVAVYARISSDQEGTALGVTRQLEDCRAMAESEGWTIAEEYVDNDVSAYSGKRRPAYERMLEDLRDGVRDGVIVYHQDRLTNRAGACR